MPRVTASLLVLLLAAGGAGAHDLSASARLERGRILVEAYFDDNTPARAAEVSVSDADGHVVAAGRTDNEGQCWFLAPAAGDYRLTVDAGDGHRKTIPLAISPAGSGTMTDGPGRNEFTRPRWIGLAIGIVIIVAVVIAARHFSAKSRAAGTNVTPDQSAEKG